jgi:predicted AlkP superfamily phosphohydrolase/phosphomutase/tetratricopeptide (TPR) repeat protein
VTKAGTGAAWGRWLPWGGGLALLLFALLGALAGVVTVPEGSFAVVGRPGGQGGRLIESGRGWRLPGLESVAVFSDERLTIDGSAPWISAEGARLERPYRFILHLRRGTPGTLLESKAAGGVELHARKIAADAFAALGGGASGDDSREQLVPAVAAFLAPLGVVPDSLKIFDPRAVVELGSAELNDLRAVYQGPDNPVMVVGIDSADWVLIDLLMARGDLPVLESLKERGAWGVLKSMKPTLSPLLWTTVVTGKTPDVHGIVDFLVDDPRTGIPSPITSRFRRVKALWSILTDMGQESLTVAWWATWPVEAVDGVMISDRVAYSLFAGSGRSSLSLAIHPPDVADSLAGLVVDAEDVSLETINEIINISDRDYQQKRRSLKNPDSYQDPVAHLFRILASTRTYHQMAVSRLKSSQPPLSLIYYQGIDEVNHRFAHCALPAMKWCDREEAESSSLAVQNFYRLQDKLLGELLEVADPGTVVMVISDHGFASGDQRHTDVPPDIEGKPGRWHTLDGIIIAAGPGVRPGRLPVDPGLMDITPTVLSLLRLPVAADMPGSVILPIAGDPGASGSATLSTYETPDRSPAGFDPAGGESVPGMDEEMLARLRALGYLGGEGEGQPARAGTVTGLVNNANALLARKKYSEAAPLYQEALVQAPAFLPARLGLAQAWIGMGQETDGWMELESALVQGTDLDEGILLKVSAYLKGEGKPREGAALFGRLPVREDLEAGRLAGMGILLSAAGDSGAAEAALKSALARAPAMPEALRALFGLKSERGAYEELIPVLEEALSARPEGVVAGNLLGLAYERSGRSDDGVAILEQLLTMSPRDIVALTNLAGMYLRRNDPGKALPHLVRALEVDPARVETRVNMILARGRLGDLDGAREIFDEDGGARESKVLLNAMAAACHLNGASEEARKHLLRSLELEPSQTEARKLLEKIGT